MLQENEMDIKEIKHAAIKLESDIYDLITKFQNDTSTIVDSVDLQIACTTGVKPELIYVKVGVKI